MFFSKAFSATAITALCSFVLLNAESANAQSGSRNGAAAGGGGSISGGAGGSGSTGGTTDGFTGTGNSGPATAQESLLRGRADVIRSVGSGVKDASEAAINFEIARSKAIENRIDVANAQNSVIQASIERQRLREEFYQARRESRSVKLTGTSKGNVPTRLASHQVSPGNGIQWPRSLRNSTFKPYRKQVEILMSQMNDGDLEAEQQIREISRKLLTKLRAQRSRISVNNYIAGKKFLNGLWVETFYVNHPLHDHMMAMK